ncbi:MAG: hypothetical protein QOJ86_4777 [Bradyrhizobium sp.]|jgi:hypothetical protein|nr:hypothetical protein [Bradyrhizobium sp.]
MQGKPAKFNPSRGYFPSTLVIAAQIWSLSSVAGALGTMTVGAVTSLSNVSEPARRRCFASYGAAPASLTINFAAGS